MHDTSDLSCARQRTERIALLNDAARQGRDRTARIVMTSGLLAEFSGDTVADSMMAQARLMAALRHCTFAPDSPERDFASMDVDGIKVLMKIDSAPKLPNSLKVWRANLDEPPAFGNLALPSDY